MYALLPDTISILAGDDLFGPSFKSSQIVNLHFHIHSGS